MTNASGAVQGSLTLSAFGQTVASSGSSTSAYQFAATSGYRNDGDAGLTHVGARYYDAQVGRFTSRDTYLDQKPYAYCEHDPVNALDPSGHNVWTQIGGGILILIGVAIVITGCTLSGEGFILPGIIIAIIGGVIIYCGYQCWIA